MVVKVHDIGPGFMVIKLPFFISNDEAKNHQSLDKSVS
jgi:hypothetical protein